MNIDPECVIRFHYGENVYVEAFPMSLHYLRWLDG